MIFNLPLIRTLTMVDFDFDGTAENLGFDGLIATNVSTEICLSGEGEEDDDR